MINMYGDYKYKINTDIACSPERLGGTQGRRLVQQVQGRQSTAGPNTGGTTGNRKAGNKIHAR